MSQKQAPFVVATSNPTANIAVLPRSPVHSPTTSSPSPKHSPIIITDHLNNHIAQQQQAEASASKGRRRSVSDASHKRQQFAFSPQGSTEDRSAPSHPVSGEDRSTSSHPVSGGVHASAAASAGPASVVVTASPTNSPSHSAPPATSISQSQTPNGHTATGMGSARDVAPVAGSGSTPATSSNDTSPTEVDGIELRRRQRPLRQAKSEVPASIANQEQRRSSQSLTDARELAYNRMMAELSKAQKELQLKDEECEKLSNLRTQMEAEVYELTAALFDEANNQVLEAEIKRDTAEKRLKEYVDKVEVLQSEVVALKHLVVTSTPSTPNKHLHPQICQLSPKKEKSSKPFWKSHRRSTSHHEFTKESRAQAEEAQQDHSKVKETRSYCYSNRETFLDVMLDPKMDTVCFDEFQRWKLQPSVNDATSSFLNRVILEDIQPCLNFHNRKLAERVLRCVEQNTLTIEPIPGDSSFPRKCSLSDMHKLCNYKIKLEEDTDWYSISQMCRNRIAAVCDYYTYIRYIVQGLVKSPDKEMLQEITRLRLQMAVARLGC